MALRRSLRCLLAASPPLQAAIAASSNSLAVPQDAAAAGLWVVPAGRHPWPQQQQACCFSAAASSPAAATPASSSQADTQPQPQPKQQPKKQPKQQEQEQQEQQAAASPALQALQQQYQRSRMHQFYTQHLARELMLKLNVSAVEQLPLVRSIDLAISAKDLHGQRYAEKWQMLLPALALEYITGQPAAYVHSRLKYYRARNAVTAVKVRVRGPAAFDLLQRLTYIVLPSQDAFSGVSSRSFDAAGNLHFRVARMVNFPDFEEQFEIFENLRSLHVSINLGNVARQHRHQRSKLLLTGLQLPIFTKGAASADAAAAGEGTASEDEEEEQSSEEDDD